MSATKLSRRHKLLAFAPALVVIGITAAVASGISVIPGASAANTVQVNGTVTASMSVSSDTNTAACGGGTPGILSVGDFSDGAFHASGGACTITYATNDPTGAHVTISDSDAAPFFCTASCTAATNDSVENPAGTPGGAALADDQFGVSLTSMSGTPAPTKGANYAAPDASPTGAEAIWAPVTPATATVCTTSAATTVNETCGVTFGVDGQGATQTAGNYTGTANFVAVTGP
jgi:hypothetical protein